MFAIKTFQKFIISRSSCDKSSWMTLNLWHGPRSSLFRTITAFHFATESAQQKCSYNYNGLGAYVCAN